MLLGAMALWFAFWGVVIAFLMRREILAAWREPMLCRPVLILESDDWGAGPVQQGDALREIVITLTKFLDRDGRHPVMTLSVILAIADGAKSKASGCYQRQLISTATHGALLSEIQNGIKAGVFTIQLHGMEHYWPPALMELSNNNKAVKEWLNQAPNASTEDLPSSLQSRWVDGSILPSRPLAAADIKQAVHDEVNAFKVIFGKHPDVVVPPTFVWNERVEEAWAEEGVEVIVTPGRRYEIRDEAGRPAGARNFMHNGQRGKKGLVYLVRDLYFEPSFGHTASQALDALAAKAQLNRPALFEIHRLNFLKADGDRNRALAEIESLLSAALGSFPNLAFLSTVKLAEIVKNRDPEWVETGYKHRTHIWIKRLTEFSRLRKLAWITGWVAPAWVVWRLTK